MRSLLIVHPSEHTMNKTRIQSYRRHRCIDVLPKSVHFRHWTLGFRQYSFNLIAQALQSHNIHVFCCSPLYRHALVSSPFQVQVSRSPRSHCSELRPTLLAILSVRDTAHTFMAHGSPSTVESLSNPDLYGIHDKASLDCLMSPPHFLPRELYGVLPD